MIGHEDFAGWFEIAHLLEVGEPPGGAAAVEAMRVIMFLLLLLRKEKAIEGPTNARVLVKHVHRILAAEAATLVFMMRYTSRDRGSLRCRAQFNDGSTKP